MVSCGPKIVQYVFFAFNLLIWILGIVVLGVGISSHAKVGTWKSLIDLGGSISRAANLLIAAGVIVALLGFLGCWGAIKKIRPLLVVYSVLVLLIVILEIAAGAYAYNKREKVEAKVADAVKKGIDENYARGDSASLLITKAIDLIQAKIKCCGADGPDDYQDSYWAQNNSTGNATVPMSCCKEQVNGCNINVEANSTTIYNKGCISQGKVWAEKNMMYLVDVGIGIAIVELAGIVCAVCLWWSFKNDYNEM